MLILSLRRTSPAARDSPGAKRQAGSRLSFRARRMICINARPHQSLFSLFPQHAFEGVDDLLDAVQVWVDAVGAAGGAELLLLHVALGQAAGGAEMIGVLPQGHGAVGDSGRQVPQAEIKDG